MFVTNSVVAIYKTHLQAEDAVKQLNQGGVNMQTLSIAGRDTHTEEQVSGFYTTGDRMLYWGKLGVFWGGLWGLLFGSALFVIPGIGPILAAGPLISWIVAGLESAVEFGAISALGAALVSIGIPKDSVIKYDTALKTDNFLLIVHGTPSNVLAAQNILAETDPISYALHA
jgi:uncharacterized membrane protein